MNKHKRHPPQHVVNVSGGKDSTATYLLAIESGRPFTAVFADTGNEHPSVYDFVQRLHERTGGPKVQIVRADFTEDLARHRDYILREWPKQGIPAETVSRAASLNTASGNPFLDLCVLKARFPSRMAQFCTERLKAQPIFNQIVQPMLKHGGVLQWLGIRADESAHRARQPRFNRHESGCFVWRPIFRWTLDQVWAIHRRHALPRNPLYDMGFHRVGCMPCIHCRKSELRNIANRAPEHIARISEWEAIVAQASKRGLATFFPAMKDPMDRNHSGTYSRIHDVVEWSRTGRGGRQYALLFNDQPGGGCNSDLALCERGPEPDPASI